MNLKRITSVIFLSSVACGAFATKQSAGITGTIEAMQSGGKNSHTITATFRYTVPAGLTIPWLRIDAGSTENRNGRECAQLVSKEPSTPLLNVEPGQYSVEKQFTILSNDAPCPLFFAAMVLGDGPGAKDGTIFRHMLFTRATKPIQESDKD